jgi:fructose-1,6-bisphosphatase
MVRHNSSFMLKDYSNIDEEHDHVMQDDSFFGGRGDN